MDNRERGYRDASLGFGVNLQMMTRLASNTNMAAPVQPAQPEQTKSQSDEAGSAIQASARPSTEMPSTAPPSSPNWIRATASCTMSVFQDNNESSQVYGDIDLGVPFRLFLPTLVDGDDQWARVQFVSGELGDLTLGWMKVANSKRYFVENLSV